MSTVTAGQITVTNSETTIVAADANRRTVTIVNAQTVPVYIGPTGLTTATGLRLESGDSVMLRASCAVYGITAAAYTASSDLAVQYVEETSA